MKNTRSVVIASWKQTEHGYKSLRYETCSVSCHHLMTMVRVWWYPLKYESCSVSCYHLMTTVRTWLFLPKVWNKLRQLSASMTTFRVWLFIPKLWNMFRQLSLSHDNCQSMVVYPLGMNHPPSVVIVSWQWSQHGNRSVIYETCSISCHRPMITYRALLIILNGQNMLYQLPLSQNNGQSMVMYSW